MSNPFYSIIMRTTGDREVTIKRAIESVISQSFIDWELIIVVDNKDKEMPTKVNNLVGLYDPIDTKKIKVFHFFSGGRMEAVSNYGVEKSSGEFICIHDDDDTWVPDFLHKVTIEVIKDKSINAVLTQHNRVFEYLHTENGVDTMQEMCRYNYCPWLLSVSQMQILAGNFIPPISLVFKKSILRDIGMYDEQFPVLGDWDFLIRLMFFTEIHVIEEPLANYFIRVNSYGIYGNTINSEKAKLHRKVENNVRYKYNLNKVLLSNYEKKDISVEINMARPHKWYWHTEYTNDIKNTHDLQPNYNKNIKQISEIIKQKYNGVKTPKIYMYGGGELFDKLLAEGVVRDFAEEFKIEGVIDQKFDGTREYTFSPNILKTDKDIDVVVVMLENPCGVLGSIKTVINKDVDVYCVAGSYD